MGAVSGHSCFVFINYLNSLNLEHIILTPLLNYQNLNMFLLTNIVAALLVVSALRLFLFTFVFRLFFFFFYSARQHLEHLEPCFTDFIREVSCRLRIPEAASRVMWFEVTSMLLPNTLADRAARQFCGFCWLVELSYNSSLVPADHCIERLSLLSDREIIR